MDRDAIWFLGVFIVATIVIGGLFVVTSLPRLDVEFAQNQTEFSKTGYVIDIDFLGGGLDSAEQTIIRFDDGEVVVLQYWKTKIPIEQNITLHYHDNGYGRCFLDNFTMLEVGK